MDNMYGQSWVIPVAIILGNDNKPLKARVLVNDSSSELSRTSTYYKNYFGRRIDYRHIYAIEYWTTENIADCETFRDSNVGDNSSLHIVGYNWLPIIDSHDNIVKDGVVLHFSQEGIIAIDARCHCKKYTPDAVSRLAQSDIKRNLFCNLDYDALPELKLTRNILTVSEHSDDININLAMSSLSGQVAPVKRYFGLMELTQDYFNQNVVLMPDSWTKLAFKLKDSPASMIALPKRVDTLDMVLNHCDKLRKLMLPESIATPSVSGALDDWALDFQFCNCLEELTFPKKLSQLFLSATKCSNLRQIVLPSNMLSDTSQSVLELTLAWCSNLERIVLPNHFNGIAKIAISDCPRVQEFVIPPDFKGIVSLDLSNNERLHRVSCHSGVRVKRFILAGGGPYELVKLDNIEGIANATERTYTMNVDIHCEDIRQLKLTASPANTAIYACLSTGIGKSCILEGFGHSKYHTVILKAVSGFGYGFWLSGYASLVLKNCSSDFKSWLKPERKDLSCFNIKYIK